MAKHQSEANDVRESVDVDWLRSLSLPPVPPSSNILTFLKQQKGQEREEGKTKT